MNRIHQGKTRPEPTALGWLVCLSLLGLGVALAVLLFTGALAVRAEELFPTPSPAPSWTALPEATEVPRYEPVTRGGRDGVAELASRTFPPADVAWVVRTARCESGYDLYAHSAGYDRRLGVYYDFWGALQVDGISWSAKARELFGGELSNPNVNFAMAAWILEHYGPSHWPICGR